MEGSDLWKSRRVWNISHEEFNSRINILLDNSDYPDVLKDDEYIRFNQISRDELFNCVTIQKVELQKIDDKVNTSLESESRKIIPHLPFPATK